MMPFDTHYAVDRFIDQLAFQLATLVMQRADALVAQQQAGNPKGLTGKQAAARLGVSERMMGRMLANGEIPSVKVGRRRLIAASTIDRMLSGDEIRGAIGEQLGGIRRNRRS